MGLTVLTFESGSHLKEIEKYGIFGCHTLKSIQIPASIITLAPAWVAMSAVQSVTFESGESLVRMLKNNTIALGPGGWVNVADWNENMDIPGYWAQPLGPPHLVCLWKIPEKGTTLK
jgi:hypothetical protein